MKNQKKSKESNQIKENFNLSSLTNRTRLRLFTKKNTNIANINTTVKFSINSDPLKQEEFEKEYHKRYLFYIKEEFNSKIITMFFNYMSSTNIIPNSFKNNRYFLKEFLRIIVDLLINEIDLVTITTIFDNMGWIAQGTEPWTYIYYICLSAKEKASSDKSFSILTQILEKNNPGFNDFYKKWLNNNNTKSKLDKVEISKINERFRELMKPIYLNENQKKFINYNEIVNKIVTMSKQKEKENNPSKINLPININSNNTNNNNINNNNISFNHQNSTIQLNNPLEIMSYQSGLNINNKYESPIKNNQQSNLELPQYNSFFDLSRGGSRNNSFFGLNIFDGELSKVPSMKFNNK